jgi:iron-only hydrogenase group A
MIDVVVDGETVRVPAGSTVMDACKAAKRFVPTLCFNPRLPPTGVCRVCLVQMSRGDRSVLVPACSTEVNAGAKVETSSPDAIEGHKSTLSMIMQDHPWECPTCEANGDCKLQSLVNRYGLEDKWVKTADAAAAHHHPHGDGHHQDVLRVRGGSTTFESRTDCGSSRRGLTEDCEQTSWLSSVHSRWDDDSTNALNRELDKCISCGRCVQACSELQGLHVLGMRGRGRGAVPMPAYDLPLSETACIQCGQCAAACPTGAIHEKPEWRWVLDELNKSRERRKYKLIVAQTAPATRVSIGEEMGLRIGDPMSSPGRLVGSLRALGFDEVYDAQFTADLTILEEGSELLARMGLVPHAHTEEPVLPQFSSCCPGWVNLVERLYPDFIPNLSSARSPQAMLSSLMKNVIAARRGLKPEEVLMVSVMPCTAKKDEAKRPQLTTPDGHPETDVVVTTRELGRMLRFMGVKFLSLPEQCEYDSPLGSSSGAATLFGVTGGVAEAAVRTAHRIITGEELKGIDYTPVRGLRGVVKVATVGPLEVGGEKKSINVAVLHGTGNARAFLDAVRAKRKGCAVPEHVPKEIADIDFDSLHFVEVMACQGGCIGGGGQPKSDSANVLQERAAAIYSLDKHAGYRVSHKNEQVKQLYDEVLGHPLSEKSHHLLHTTYTDRSSAVKAGPHDVDMKRGE